MKKEDPRRMNPMGGSKAPVGRIERGKHGQHIEVLLHVPSGVAHRRDLAILKRPTNGE
jgi:hypothetical protein